MNRTLLLGCLLLAGCGPRVVRSPDWIRGESVQYPSAQYLIGVGAAPTQGGLPAALKAAGASARAELAQILEVRIDYLQQFAETSAAIEERRAGQARIALEAERSEISAFTRTSTEQVVQGIVLKEQYHDQKRGVLYVLAVLDRAASGARLQQEIEELEAQIGGLTERARLREQEGELIAAVRLYRQALNLGLKAEALRDQLRVIDPRRARAVVVEHPSGELALTLIDRLTRCSFYTSVEGYPLIEDSIHEALVEAGFNAKLRREGGEMGLTLWGTVSLKRGTFPALGEESREQELQVCRAYLGIKIVDDRSGAIVGQVNLLDNSNALDEKIAEERALQLLRQRILRELPGALYRALSVEME